MTWSSPGTQKSTSSHYDQVYGLTQIPQVVINIYYKVGPIADKNVAVGPSHVFSLRYTVRFLWVPSHIPVHKSTVGFLNHFATWAIYLGFLRFPCIPRAFPRVSGSRFLMFSNEFLIGSRGFLNNIFYAFLVSDTTRISFALSSTFPFLFIPGVFLPFPVLCLKLFFFWPSPVLITDEFLTGKWQQMFGGLQLIPTVLNFFRIFRRPDSSCKIFTAMYSKNKHQARLGWRMF